MQIEIKPNSFFVFDLDDTLYPEIEFLRSGFRVIARQLEQRTGTNVYEEMWVRYRAGENVFAWIAGQYQDQWPGLTVAQLLKIYREHEPEIQLRLGAIDLLNRLAAMKVPAGLITDGRSITQRNKLKALYLHDYFTDTIISEEFGSEKPAERNYRYFEEKYPGRQFTYIGDNTTKDFLAPAKLGWFTCCLKSDGNNIHTQVFDLPSCPAAVINSFDEIQLT
ncbi:HAD family hydrolase [Paraflavitalea sp. CAU 1676]|uniref:HAD family hydrolase n=1 Tax=Paraflavitalea sp. CAU 1676 TaxID=3032598 RepID=UPI0023DC310A|nr:HAD family hydrolase [Paraflavitalea sp. CAU 1676]MDF2189672.1 HAD family hydrolase [Paraflavitalea sp. CAU 1676]